MPQRDQISCFNADKRTMMIYFGPILYPFDNLKQAWYFFLLNGIAMLAQKDIISSISSNHKNPQAEIPSLSDKYIRLSLS